MDGLIFSGEGWPLTQDALAFVENAYKSQIDLLVKALGDNVIYTEGYNQGDTSFNDGFVIFEGELLPFQGGEVQGAIRIIEEVEEQGYDTAGTGDFSNQMPVWKKRYAKFTSEPSEYNIPLTWFTRVNVNSNLFEKATILKRGMISLNSNLESYLAAGDFISVEPVANGDLSNNLFFRVTLNTELQNSDYTILVETRDGSNGYTPDAGVLTVLKDSDNFVISLADAGGETVYRTMEIYLIG